MQVKSRHLVDELTGSSDADLQEAAVIFGRIDKDQSGLITLPRFVEAMNALNEGQGKKKHADTQLLALLQSEDTSVRRCVMQPRFPAWALDRSARLCPRSPI